MKLKKHLKEIIITLSVISLTAVGYAAVTGVISGDTLTANLWNDMKTEVDKLINVYNVGGNVGIGTTNPSIKLDVSGGVKVGVSSVICESSIEGSMKWDTINKRMQVCNGSNWLPIYTQFIRYESTATKGTGEQSHFVDCPTGWIITGGGCYNNRSQSEMLYGEPYDNGFKCVHTTTISDQNIKAVAICAK